MSILKANALVIAFALLVSAQVLAQAANITGEWAFNVTTDQGAGTPVITFKQEGEKLTGKYAGQLGNADLTGTLKGNAIHFTFTLDVQGQQAPVTIYSMASSTPEDAPRGMDFLYSRNRLNVAVSRAQGLAIVVASPALFRVRCKTPNQMRLANALCLFQERAQNAEARVPRSTDVRRALRDV